MCTAIAYKTNDFYFGRNLDFYRHFDESVTITPRNFNFKFKNDKDIFLHFAIIGTATVSENYPLYYDAVNEHGLCMAGLNFPKNAVYRDFEKDKINIAPFEFIPYILSRCKSVGEAEKQLNNINLWNISFSDNFINTPLHWMICDKDKSIVVEPMRDGLEIYDNPVGVLTNNPPFDYHLNNIANFINLTTKYPQNRFCESVGIEPYSLGMGAVGLPGDMSSASRFIRAAFIKQNSVRDINDLSSINQAFHILKSVGQPNGITYTKDGEREYTLYTSVCNATSGVYYYTTYYNSVVSAVRMYNENLDGDSLSVYPFNYKQNIIFQN